MSGTTLKNIYVFGMYEMEYDETFHSGAIISIVSPFVEREVDLTKYDYALALDFDDLNTVNLELKRQTIVDYAVFNDDMANEIWDFVDLIKNKVKNLTIHCEAGISRSPALAYTIYDALKPSIKIFKCVSDSPNDKVMEIMNNTYKTRNSLKLT